MTQLRRLVILMTGISPEDLALGSSPWLNEYFCGAGRTERLITAAGRPTTDQLIDSLPAGVVRDLGIEVDQRSIVLRGRRQSDDVVMQQLAHRTTGPADLTLLWLRDHTRAAIEFGLHSTQHRDALARLERHVQVAYEFIQAAGAPVQLTLLTASALQPVRRAFDPVGILCQGLSQGLRKRCSIHRRLSHLQIESPSTEDTRNIERLLSSSPCRNYGRIVGSEEKLALGLPYRPGEITFVPLEGVAFADHAVQAAPRFLSNDDGAAVLPWLSEKAARSELAEAGQRLLAELVESRDDMAPVPELTEVLEAADLTPLALPADSSRTEELSS